MQQDDEERTRDELAESLEVCLELRYLVRRPAADHSERDNRSGDQDVDRVRAEIPASSARSSGSESRSFAQGSARNARRSPGSSPSQPSSFRRTVRRNRPHGPSCST